MHVKNIELKGKYFAVGDTTQTVRSVFFDGGDVGSFKITEMKGWWERSDGSEGGDLVLGRDPSGEWSVNDFDGAYDLPKYLREDLKANGVVIDF